MLTITSVAPCNIYGPNDNFEVSSSHVVPGLIRRLYDVMTKGIVFMGKTGRKPDQNNVFLLKL